MGEIGYDSFDHITIGLKYGINRTGLWGMTAVDSFESVVGVSSQTVQNLYVAVSDVNRTFGMAAWVLGIPSRVVGFSETVEDVTH